MPIETKTYYDYLNIKLLLGKLRINIISITHYPFKPNKKIPNHCHGTYEIHFIKSGKGTVRINHKTYQVSKGMFYLTGPNIYHEQTADEEQPMSEFSVNFDYEVLHHSLYEKDFHEDFNKVLEILRETHFFIAKDSFNYLDVFESIFFELHHQYFGYYESVQNYCYQILIHIIRCFLHQQESDYTIPNMDLNDLRRKLIDDIFCYHYATTNLDKAAKTLKITKRQLERVVKQYYGTSFHDKLLSVKMEQAKFLLRNTDSEIYHIALELGFSTPNYFSRIFKKKTGLTPKNYREKSSSIYAGEAHT